MACLDSQSPRIGTRRNGDGADRRRGIDPWIHQGRAGAVLPGVSLTATTPQSSTPFSAVSDSQGFYRLVNLPPGTYDVIAALQGFSRFERKGLEVRARRTSGRRHAEARRDRGNDPGDGRDADARSAKTTQAISISGEFQRSLPLSGRRVWRTRWISPGIMSRSTDQFGGSVYFLRGTENENHVVQVDGVDAGSFHQELAGTISRPELWRRSPTSRSRPPGSMRPARRHGHQHRDAVGHQSSEGERRRVFTARSWNGNNTRHSRDLSNRAARSGAGRTSRKTGHGSSGIPPDAARPVSAATPNCSAPSTRSCQVSNRSTTPGN